MYRTGYGRVSWTLRTNPITGRNEWVRPGTNEVDSRRAPECDFSSIGAIVGARPKKGEQCYKGSEDLIRSLTNEAEAARREVRELRRKRVRETARDLETGKVKIDPELVIGMPTFSVPLANGAKIIVREDRVAESERLRIEAERERALEDKRERVAREEAAREEVERAERPRRPVSEVLKECQRQIEEAKTEPAPVTHIFEGGDGPAALPPTDPTPHVDQAKFEQWTPQRNPYRRML